MDPLIVRVPYTWLLESFSGPGALGPSPSGSQEQIHLIEALAGSKMLSLLHPLLNSRQGEACPYHSDGFAQMVLSLSCAVTLQAMHTGPVVSPYRSPSS